MDNIGKKLTEIASKYVDFSLAEAETESYPYAVYTSNVTPVYTKDGIYRYDATVTVTVYSKDLDEADGLADTISEAVMTEMNDGIFSARMENSYPDCIEGIWSRVISFNIKQNGRL